MYKHKKPLQHAIEHAGMQAVPQVEWVKFKNWKIIISKACRESCPFIPEGEDLCWL